MSESASSGKFKFPIYVHHYANGSIDINVPPSQKAVFMELVHRATNLWPDAPPSIKAFADQVTNEGKLMQDYNKVAVTQQPKKAPATTVCLCTGADAIHCPLSCPRHP